jgi:iron(III) transport system permease protein
MYKIPQKIRLLFPYIILATATFFILQPAAFLLFGSIWSTMPGRPGEITLANYLEVLNDPFLGKVLLNTLLFALGASSVAIALGTVLALLVMKTDAPFRHVAVFLPILTFAMPSSVESMSWTFLLSPRTGLVNIAFMRLTGLEEPLVNVYSLIGMTLVMGLNLMPVAFMIIAPSFSLFDRSLEEMARVSGAGVSYLFRKVTLPLVAPSIISAFIYCFIVALEAFDTPAIIGIPAGIYVLTTSIYTQMVSEVPPRYGTATAYATILLAISIAAILLYSIAASKADRYATLSGRATNVNVLRLGKYRYLGTILIVGYLFIHPIPLLITLGIASVHRFWNPDRLFTNLTLENYEKFFTYPVASTAVMNSIIVSISSVTLTVAIGFLATYFTLRRNMRGGHILNSLLSIPLALPPTVLAVGVFWSVLYFDIGLYGTVWALVYAYTLRYVPLVIRFLSGPMLQIHKDLDESAILYGGGVVRTLTRITLPLLWGAVSAAALYVFIRTFTDLGIAVLLVTRESTVLSTTLFALWNTGEKLTVVAGGVVYVFFLLLLLLVAYRLGFRLFEQPSRYA